jgi:hypothetical protein
MYRKEKIYYNMERLGWWNFRKIHRSIIWNSSNISWSKTRKRNR